MKTFLFRKKIVKNKIVQNSIAQNSIVQNNIVQNSIVKDCLSKITRLVIVFVVVLTATVGCRSNVNSEPIISSTDDNKVEATNLSKSLAVDLSYLDKGDGQPILQEPEIKVPPIRPDDPLSLPQLDKNHWYDVEYAGLDVRKINIPISPKDGAIGKTIITIVNGNHPYMTAYGIGAKKIADAYQMKFLQFSSDWDADLQSKQIDQAITMKPDMIIINPLDVKTATQELKKINEAGIPVIVSNMLAEADGMRYAIAWTGPDDWGQFRLLARVLADKLDKKGGVAYLTHSVGGSVYYSRLMGAVTELAEYAPDMKTLDYQSPGFDKQKAKDVVAKWLATYKEDINAIVCADDSSQLLGTLEAIKEAGRKDIIIVAAGNSKDGMDAIKNGDVYAITYQSAQADGALAVKIAADWFNGLEIEPVSYLPKHIITIKDVDTYMPAEWQFGQ